MVIFPPEFVATRYPGYFWNTETKKLYTIKVTGELRPLKFSPGGSFGRMTWQPGYRVSVNGVNRKYTMAYLNKLKASTTDQVIKVKK